MKPLPSLAWYTTILMMQLAEGITTGTKFSSHIRVRTPDTNYEHGVGDPISSFSRRSLFEPVLELDNFHSGAFNSFSGYDISKPLVPFYNEDAPPLVQNLMQNSIVTVPYNWDSQPIPILPPSPYKVDSADPESVWPEGLYLPPTKPVRFGPLLSKLQSNGYFTQHNNNEMPNNFFRTFSQNVHHAEPYLSNDVHIEPHEAIRIPWS